MPLQEGKVGSSSGHKEHCREKYNTNMGLPRPIIWLLAILWSACFVVFVLASIRAYASGTTFEYEFSGVQFPYVMAVLLAFMSAASGLLWFNYRGEDFRGAEETIYGSLFGLSVFGLVLSVILALLA